MPRLPNPTLIAAHGGACLLPLLCLSLIGPPASAGAAAAEADEPPVAAAPPALSEVVVKGTALQSDKSAFTATTVTSDVIRGKRLTKVEQIFRDVPGMFVSDYGLGGVANPIVIRGFGAGGHGGDIGVVIDGIPLNEAVSHADGYVDLSVVIPLEVGSVTIFKGPVSALYGNFNRGGLISLETRKTGDYAQTDLRYGSFNTLDAQAAYGGRIDDRQRVNLAAQYFRTDGYRPQSDGYRATVAGRYSVDLTPVLNLALSTRLHTTDSNDPAYITLAQYRINPYGIDPRVQNDAASKRFGTFRSDLNYQIDPDLKLLTFAYTTQQTFARSYSRPVTPTTYAQREETYQRQVYGAGTSLNGRVMVFDRPISFVSGVEAYSETTAYQFYDGLIHRQHTAPAIDDRRSKLNTASAFGEAQVQLLPLLDLSLGLRIDNFTGDCVKRGPETTTDPCGSLKPITPVSPKVGLQSQILPWLKLRASYAEGFALPSAFIKYAAGAAGLTTQNLHQTEVGAKIVASDRFDMDVAAYRLTSDGEIATVGPGVYENLGSTVRRGVEVSANWRTMDTLTFGAVYGYAESKVTTNINPALIGKRVTGVPDNSATFNVSWTPIRPITFNADERYVGSYAADTANTLIAPSFNIFDAGVSYALPTPIAAHLSFNVDNLFDKTYATAVFLSQGIELLAPAAPRVFRVGVQLDF